MPEGCTTVFLTAPPLPSLISSCLNLIFGTQGRSWRLNEAYFLPTRNGGHRRASVPRCLSRSWFHEHGQGWATKCLVLKEWSGWYDTGFLHCWVNYGYADFKRMLLKNKWNREMHMKSEEISTKLYVVWLQMSITFACLHPWGWELGWILPTSVLWNFYQRAHFTPV